MQIILSNTRMFLGMYVLLTCLQTAVNDTWLIFNHHHHHINLLSLPGIITAIEILYSSLEFAKCFHMQHFILMHSHIIRDILFTIPFYK
jgi:hypothetical protein